MKGTTRVIPQEPLEQLIRVVRRQRVILAGDLAQVYGVPTKRLNEQVKRNENRFPTDFMFQLTAEEAETVLRSRSQIATLKRGQNIKHMPYAFTEHGAIMAANVLKSPRAIQMSVFVVRAFVKMREVLAQNKELAAKLAELERNLALRLDDHGEAIAYLLQEIKKLMEPPPAPKRREIGFLRD